ncbi:hypothetical protein ACIA8G_02145 [Lentzea sp. NPDC051213]|uniref:hypothetical protein n=1 Tax=Lentzea sp. NPDC051213 TaxID=3364126 RepID=UPI0037922770
MRWLLGALLILSACGSEALPPVSTTTRPSISQEEQIREVHRTFVRAWNATNSKEALPVLSRRSAEYVETLRGHALRSTEEQLVTLQFGDRLKVYELRASPKLEVVRGGTAHDLLTLVVELEGSPLEETALTGLEVRDTSASDGTWAFHHEGGEWKVSLAEVVRAKGAALMRDIEEKGVSPDVYVIGSLRLEYGDDRALEILKPLN